MKTRRPCADIVQTHVRFGVRRVHLVYRKGLYSAGNRTHEGSARTIKSCTTATLQPLQAPLRLQHIAT